MLKLNINDIPERPGVYIFKSKTEVLYVGKAKNLKNRIKTHLLNKTAFVKKAEKLEYILTKTESESLLLEANLIKQYKPRYNIRLTDDKKYPYIAITQNEMYPVIFLTRNLTLKDAEIFGPYMSASSIRKSLKILREIFPVRNCKYKLPSKRAIKPCIEYHMGLCPAPCVQGLVDPEEYKKNVDGIRQVLKGNINKAVEYLEKEMKKAAEDLNFEYAASLRDKITSLHELKYHFYISSLKEGSIDIIGMRGVKDRTYFYIIFYRDGKVVQTAYYKMEHSPNTPTKDALFAFLSQFYTSLATTSEKILVPVLPEDKKALEETLGVSIEIPSKEFKKLLDIAMENAEEVALNEEKKRHKVHPALLEIKEIFGLSHVPERIECVDASQLFGAFRVASLVVFEKGRPKKSEYRRYRIKTPGKDDFAMIYETTLRRFKRALSEGSGLPDMYILDGGLLQLKAALKAKFELGLKNVLFVAFAKRFDDFYIEDGGHIMLPQRSFSLKLFKRIRDEAHRFAITYHRNLRGRESFKDFLDYIPDIGEKRKKALLFYFGSLKKLRDATVDELVKVPGIGPKLAEKLYNFLHED